MILANQTWVMDISPEELLGLGIGARHDPLLDIQEIQIVDTPSISLAWEVIVDGKDAVLSGDPSDYQVKFFYWFAEKIGGVAYLDRRSASFKDEDTRKTFSLQYVQYANMLSEILDGSYDSFVFEVSRNPNIGKQGYLENSFLAMLSDIMYIARKYGVRS